MYNQEELKQMQSPDMQIKELQMRLKESEKEIIRLRKDQSRVIQEVQELRSREMQEQLIRGEAEEVLKVLYEEVMMILEENGNMRKTQNQSPLKLTPKGPPHSQYQQNHQDFQHEERKNFITENFSNLGALILKDPHFIYNLNNNRSSGSPYRKPISNSIGNITPSGMRISNQTPISGALKN